MKILIIRFSSIGDIVLTTPVIRCLKAQLPEVELHFLTKDGFAPVLEHHPDIQVLHRLGHNKHQVIEQLKSERFDWVIDLQHNRRSISMSRKLGAPTKRFFKANIEKWLLVNFKINRLPDKHIVDRYLETVAHLGIKNDGKGLDFHLPALSIDPKRLPDFINRPFVGFVIGGAHQTKCLPVHKIVAAINLMPNKPVILLGGPGDQEKAKDIVSQVSHQHVFDACGKFNLLESAFLVKQAAKIITHDTGLMHIAAAFNKPIVSVWGNTVPAFGMYPYLPKNAPEHQIVEVNKLHCRPCSKIGYKKCPKGHFKCMELIDVAELMS